MNAGLAKPIPAIWFIRASAVDVHQSLAAALCPDLRSWLRDHLHCMARPRDVATHNQKF
jgi:hypothetical protein